MTGPRPDRGGPAPTLQESVPAVTAVGVDGGPLDAPAAAAVRAARVVLGGRRHLDAVATLLPPGARRLELGGDLPGALATLGDELATGGPAVVLASGDPGFFGIVRALTAALGPVRVLPAVSSVAQAFARAGVPWDDAVVVSAHGRDPARAVNACRRCPKVAVLTQPGFGPAELGAALRGQERRLVVAERLGTAAEQVRTVAPAEAAARHWEDPNVVLVVDPAHAHRVKGWVWPPRQTPTGWALDESAFTHRDGMITKQEVRAVALAWLGPGLGDLVWDVGAGSGSVAVECARLGAAVVAVDADPAQCGRVRTNAAAHGVPVEVAEGSAPAALAGLPDPDAVFVGGGGPRIPEIAHAAALRSRRAVVVALATVERVSPTQSALAAAGLRVTATLLQAARLTTLSDGHRLAATNPVFLLRGVREPTP